jgi:hypothetical protein
MISDQVVPSAVAQCIIIKFLTNENVKPAEILIRLTAQLSDEMLSRTQEYDCSKLLKGGQTEVESM